ncbi:phage baseplate assembly protein V [uncultured Demequina sp.]|uniref:phage baseplate assembly protein V n=1 Tax=uncultured Demequina sp. TaxID=693499 RepID=UPI0025D02D8D|nr:phage baseplate assembly protein V [uncultured Demequina sp.]
MTRYGTDATPDRPEFEIRVDGAAVDAGVHQDVIDIDASDEVGRHGRLTVLVQNWDPDTREVRHSDDGPFTPGAAVEVLVGYHSALETVFDGVITSLTTHFPRGGRPVLRVEARSRSVLLDRLPRSRQFEDVTDEDVASAIASDYGLTADTAAGVTRAAVVTDRRCDWDVLTARASQLGWVTYVRGDVLTHRPPASAEAAHELEHGLNITELHLTQDVAGAVTSTTAAGWERGTLEAIESEATQAQAELDIGERPDHEAAADETGWPLRDERRGSPAIADAAEAAARAAGRQRGAVLGHCYGTATIVGNPAIRCDQWITIAGVGERMSGPHFVTATRHRVSSHGYATELQVGSPPRVQPRAPRSDGSLSLGIVASLDDPEGLNRVRVRMPWRGDAGDGVWARVASLDAGEDCGAVFTPSIGQEVVVGCVDAEAGALVVLGTLYNGVQGPPYVSDDDNHVRAVVTPAGLRLVFDDEKPSVSIETPGAARTLTLDDDAGAITLTDGSSTVVLDDAGITLDAAQDITLKAGGTVAIEGLQFTSKASASSKFESSGSFDLEASAVLGLKGALVNIN